jgi:hypothetical protein
MVFFKGLEPGYYQASLTDLSGKKVLETKVEDRIDVASLKPGMYLIQLKAENGNFVGSHYFIKD